MTVFSKLIKNSSNQSIAAKSKWLVGSSINRISGLAKTLAIKTLAQLIDADFSRIQFTPDLLPADVVGTMIYSQKDEKFNVKKGPIFANFVLADEINRAPAKVQSALLEGMQEFLVRLGLPKLHSECHRQLHPRPL